MRPQNQTHGVRWLENNHWKYLHHHLEGMPGCYDAKPIDMYGDGDLDIVYSALYFQWQQADFPSLKIPAAFELSNPSESPMHQ